MRHWLSASLREGLPKVPARTLLPRALTHRGKATFRAHSLPASPSYLPLALSAGAHSLSVEVCLLEAVEGWVQLLGHRAGVQTQGVQLGGKVAEHLQDNMVECMSACMLHGLRACMGHAGAAWGCMVRCGLAWWERTIMRSFMLSWMVCVESEAICIGEPVLPFSKASYASAMASPGTPRSVDEGRRGDWT